MGKWDAPSSDDKHKEIEVAETDPFGPAPTEAVFTPYGNPTDGYTEPARFGRRMDGRPVRLGGVQGEPTRKSR